MKLGFLTVMPSPYMEDFFDALSADRDLSIRVLYQEMTAPDTHWNQDTLPSYAQVLPGKWYPFWGGRMHHNPTVITELERADADLYIVQGYAGMTSQKAMRWLNRTRRPWVFWGEVPGMRKRGWIATKLRDKAMQPLRKGPVAIAGIGTRAVDAYRRLTENRVPVANIPYHCDLARFQEADANRTTSGSTVTVLYCGQLIERKGIATLLGAFRSVADSIPQLHLKLVGTGPLQESLEQELTAEERARIHFAGFQPVEALPSLFAQADLFVLPSLHDGWGVVVNQALGAGLPLVCSDAVGASELIQPGWNGELFPAGDEQALAEILLKLGRDSELRQQYAAHSRERAREWTLAAGVQRWKDLIASVKLSATRNPAHST